MSEYWAAGVILGLCGVWMMWTAIALFRANRLLLANVEIVAGLMVFCIAIVLTSPW